METIFKNKVCWVTGASSGIGKEIAIQLAQKGAILVLSARNEEALITLRKTLTDAEKHLILPLDLEFSANFSVLAEEVLSKLGRIDYLFNNGGLSQRAEASKTPLEVDRRIMEINYFGNIALTKAVLPYFLKQKSGHIIVISSISGKFGFFLRSAYAASKHALHGFYESLALEEEHNNLKVTIAMPGKINTPISTNALTEKGERHGVMDHNQATGMPVEVCVSKLLTAVEKGKREILIGNKEIKAVTLKRLLPNIFWKVIRKQSAV
jgi:dehydrogenase/reductase SDR family member 7B